jgi:hypothetical protein
MALPVTFANLTNPTLPQLDTNFSALGALTPIPCAISGTNALAFAPTLNTPTVNAYVNYQSFVGVAVNANSGPATAQVGALPFLQIYKDTPAGAVVLSGSEIIPNTLLTLTYDSALNAGGGGFHLEAAAQGSTGPVVGSYRNLIGSAPGAATTASWTVTELIAETVVGGAAVKGASLALSFNGSTVGAGGMDTGTIPATANLAIYAIYNPTTNVWNTLGQATGAVVPTSVYTGAHMPAGYVHSALIWTGVSNGSSNLRKFYQVGQEIYIGQTSIVNATAATANTYVAVSVSTVVPYGALFVGGSAGSTSTSAASQTTVAADTSGNFSQPIVVGNSTVALDGFGSSGSFSLLPLTTPQQFAWKSGTNTVNTTITVDRYVF